MEELTRTQVIMLVLLVSFVTSLVTGIVTVTLVNQAPPPITQTINKVVEKTIEIVTLADSKPNNQVAIVAPQPVVVTQENLIVKIVEDISSAVVSVITSGVGASGTGFFVSEDGLIVTNKHVVKDINAKYSIVTSGGESMGVEIIALDSTNDVAILKIASSTKEKFKYIPLGNSDGVKVGQTVIAIGNTLSEFQNIVSVGIISSLNKNVTTSGLPIGQGGLQSLIQTNLTINEGNSGGPLLDLEGKVVGINIITPNTAENIGFALSINVVKRTIKDIKEFGEIVYPYVGINYQVINKNVQKEKGLSVDYGLLLKVGVNSEPAIVKDSPADKAGLIEGDIILELDNIKLTGADLFLMLLNKKRVGDDVWFKILRKDKGEIIIKVTLEKK